MGISGAGEAHARGGAVQHPAGDEAQAAGRILPAEQGVRGASGGGSVRFCQQRLVVVPQFCYINRLATGAAALERCAKAVDIVCRLVGWFARRLHGRAEEARSFAELDGAHALCPPCLQSLAHVFMHNPLLLLTPPSFCCWCCCRNLFCRLLVRLSTS